MIPVHCLWTKSNNRTCSQFECDMTWFCFWKDLGGGGGGGLFKIGRPRSREWKYFRRIWTGGWGS